MIYHVMVRGYWGPHGMDRAYVLIEADNPDRAGKLATELVESQAPSDRKWVGFEWGEISRAELPLVLSNIKPLSGGSRKARARAAHQKEGGQS